MKNNTETKVVITMRHVDHAEKLTKALTVFFDRAALGGDTALLHDYPKHKIFHCGTIGHDVSCVSVDHVTLDEAWTLPPPLCPPNFSPPQFPNFDLPITGTPGFNQSGSKYLRDIKGAIDGKIDVYAVLVTFNVTCPARQHAIKKLLCSGIRDKGSLLQDLAEARDAVDRAIQMAQMSLPVPEYKSLKTELEKAMDTVRYNGADIRMKMPGEVSGL